MSNPESSPKCALQIELVPAEVARMGVLSSYAVGSMTRSTAMKLLGLTWYGQLLDAMKAAGLQVKTNERERRAMAAEIEQLLGIQA